MRFICGKSGKMYPQEDKQEQYNEEYCAMRRDEYDLPLFDEDTDCDECLAREGCKFNPKV